MQYYTSNTVCLSYNMAAVVGDQFQVVLRNQLISLPWLLNTLYTSATQPIVLENGFKRISDHIRVQ